MMPKWVYQSQLRDTQDGWAPDGHMPLGEEKVWTDAEVRAVLNGIRHTYPGSNHPCTCWQCKVIEQALGQADTTGESHERT